MPEAPARAGSDAKPEPQILFQHFFKSVGPRTYVAQVKEAATGNHFLLLTEGKRDDKTGDVRKTKLIVFSEDFPEFFRMVEAAAKHIQANPVPAEVKRKQQQFWARKAKEKRGDASSPNAPAGRQQSGGSGRSMSGDRRSASTRPAPAARR